MVSQVETLYGWISLSALAESPKERPTSMTSGACGPGLSLLALIASISSPEPASGVISLTVRPYLALKSVDDLAVVAPVVGQGDDRQLAFLLGGVDRAPGWRRRRRPRRTRRWTGPRSTRSTSRRRRRGMRRPAGRRPGSGNVVWTRSLLRSRGHRRRCPDACHVDIRGRPPEPSSTRIGPPMRPPRATRPGAAGIDRRVRIGQPERAGVKRL